MFPIDQIVRGTIDSEFVNDKPQADKLYQKLAGAVFDFFFDGNFTTVVITTAKGDIYTGVSKRNKLDKPNPIRGRALALSRAIKGYIEQEMTGFAKVAFSVEFNPQKPEDTKDEVKLISFRENGVETRYATLDRETKTFRDVVPERVFSDKL